MSVLIKHDHLATVTPTCFGAFLEEKRHHIF